jgi:hypothetical protein
MRRQRPLRLAFFPRYRFSDGGLLSESSRSERLVD